jgi:hypothetical protein
MQEQLTTCLLCVCLFVSNADLVTFVRAGQMFKSYSINQAQLISTTVYRVEAGAA